MNPAVKDALCELKARLQKRVTLLELRLFGSAARGDGSPDSDVDVFVLVESLNSEEKSAIKEIAWETGLRRGLLIAPLIFTRQEITGTPVRSSEIVRNIMKEGVVA